MSGSSPSPPRPSGSPVESPLSRAAGPVALVAGGLFAAVDLALLVLIDPENRTVSLSETVPRVFNAAYFFTFVGLVIALIAVHGRQAREAGTFGLVAFLAALVGTMTQGGNMWFDGFAAPWLAEVAPQVFTGEKTVILMIGGGSSYVLFALGWVLYGIASLRARVFPVAISLAMVAAGVLGFNSGLPPYGVPIGLVIAALGGWLIHHDRSARAAAAAAV